MNFIGGDQSILRQGLLRALAIKKHIAEKGDAVLYFVHDIDLCSSKVPDPTSITKKPYIVPNLGINGTWSAITWDFPFRPIVPDEKDFPGMNKQQVSNVIKFLRDECYDFTWKEGLVVPDPYLSGFLSPNNYDGFQRLIYNQYHKEVNWALEFLRLNRVNGSHGLLSDAQDRAKLLMDEVTMRTYMKAGTNFSKIQRRLARIMLDDLLDFVEISSSSELFHLPNMSRGSVTLRERLSQQPECMDKFNLVLRFLGDEKCVGLYNEAINGHGIKPITANELPFVTIETIERSRFTRCTLMRDRKFDDEKVFGVMPKAVPLVVQIRQMGSFYFTDLGYLPASQKLANLLNVSQKPMYRVKFNCREVLGSLFPDSIPNFPISRGLEKTRLSAVKTMQRKTLEYWSYRPTLIFYWIIGGIEMIHQLIDTAIIEPVIER